MTLKERARTWLGINPTPKPSAPGSRLPPAGLAGQGARLRETVDNPTLAYIGGLQILAPFDPERRWRGLNLDDGTLDKISTPQLLDLLAELSPETSQALWHLLRLANPGWKCKAYRPGTAQVIDDRAQAALDQFLNVQLKGLYGSVDTVINRLYTGAFLRGAFFAELVLDNAGRVPLDIAVPDAQYTYFRIELDPERGPIWVPYQYQRGLAVLLDRPTIRYIPIDPLPASPYGRPLAGPAVFTTLFVLGLLHDLRRVISQQGYPRIDISIELDELIKTMPPDLAGDPEAVRAWLAQAAADVAKLYRQLAPDDAYIHTTTTKVNRPVGTVDTSSLGAVEGIMKALERHLMRGLKSNPLLMGMDVSSSETTGNRTWELTAAGIKALQHLCESLFEHLLSVALQAQGLQAVVEFRFAELRAAELLRDAQVASLQAQVAFFKYQAGWISQDAAALDGAGQAKADVPEPRAMPTGLTITGSKVADPGQAQADPGSNRQLLTVSNGRTREGKDDDA